MFLLYGLKCILCLAISNNIYDSLLCVRPPAARLSSRSPHFKSCTSEWLRFAKWTKPSFRASCDLTTILQLQFLNDAPTLMSAWINEAVTLSFWFYVIWCCVLCSGGESELQLQLQLGRPVHSARLAAAASAHLQTLLCVPGQVLGLPLRSERLRGLQGNAAGRWSASRCFLLTASTLKKKEMFFN